MANLDVRIRTVGPCACASDRGRRASCVGAFATEAAAGVRLAQLGRLSAGWRTECEGQRIARRAKVAPASTARAFATPDRTARSLDAGPFRDGRPRHSVSHEDRFGRDLHQPIGHAAEEDARSHVAPAMADDRHGDLVGPGELGQRLGGRSQDAHRVTIGPRDPGPPCLVGRWLRVRRERDRCWR